MEVDGVGTVLEVAAAAEGAAAAGTDGDADNELDEE